MNKEALIVTGAAGFKRICIQYEIHKSLFY